MSELIYTILRGKENIVESLFWMSVDLPAITRIGWISVAAEVTRLRRVTMKKLQHYLVSR